MSIDYRLAFDLAPLGLALSTNRVIVDCNQALCEMFGVDREQLIGSSFQSLYPSAAEYERIGARIDAVMRKEGVYSDQRIMRRMEGPHRGEHFWCRVSGRAVHQGEPHLSGVWAFEDLGRQRQVKVDLTPREREVAAYLTNGRTSKQIARALNLSHRTVEIYRANLIRKFGAVSTADLVVRLVSG